MNLKLNSRIAKNVEIFFLITLIFLISISCFLPLPAGRGQVGIKARPLNIIDRYFYINDDHPFSGNGYGEFKGGPLYPKVLESVSFISIKIFKQTTISNFWNTLVIFISSILSFCTLRLFYFSGKNLLNEQTGIIAMAIYAACPYTYFYTLSGGITIYTLFGTSACTYFILKIQNSFDNIHLRENRLFFKIFLSIFLIFMALLRPDSMIFSLIISIILIIKECINFKSYKVKTKLLFLYILFFSIPLAISLHQLWETKMYSIIAIDDFASEQGTFLGYDRDLLREKINIMRNNSELLIKVKSIILQIIWKINDCFTGLIDLRDTHQASSNSLFSFLIRVSIGSLFLAPITYISLVGIFIYKKLFLKTNLWISFVACLFAISPSLLGVSMSRYYFMFITPFILITSVTLNQMYSSKITKNIK